MKRRGRKKIDGCNWFLTPSQSTMAVIYQDEEEEDEEEQKV